MTSASLHGATALALNEIKPVHCLPPAYKPAQTVRGTIPCTACSGTIKYTVRATDGGSTGRCTSTGCLSWSE